MLFHQVESITVLAMVQDLVEMNVEKRRKIEKLIDPLAKIAVRESIDHIEVMSEKETEAVNATNMDTTIVIAIDQKDIIANTVNTGITAG